MTKDRIEALLAHPSYVRPDHDAAFLQRDEMRAVRLQLDYLKPETILDEHGVHHTVVAFGGSRIRERTVAEKQLQRAQRALAGSPDDEVLKRAVRRAERVVASSPYYDVARAFGRIVHERSHHLWGEEALVVTGGGPGIMEAANRGADEAGAPSIGLNITLPHEQAPNPYITPELCFQFRYFAIRKLHFLKRARAMVAFPGGYGTLDELFESLCLIQTQVIAPMPVVLVSKDFWTNAVNIDFLVEEGVIDPQDAHLFTIAETAEEIWDRITQWHATHPSE